MSCIGIKRKKNSEERYFIRLSPIKDNIISSRSQVSDNIPDCNVLTPDYFMKNNIKISKSFSTLSSVPKSNNGNLSPKNYESESKNIKDSREKKSTYKKMSFSDRQSYNRTRFCITF